MCCEICIHESETGIDIPVNPYSLLVSQLFLYFGGYGHIEKRIQENIIFMRFCCCFKLSKKISKLSNEQPINAIAKHTLTAIG